MTEPLPHDESAECEEVLAPCCKSFKGRKAGAAYQCIVDGLLALGSS